VAHVSLSVSMREDEEPPDPVLVIVVLEDTISATHPLRVMRAMYDPILRVLSPRFDADRREVPRWTPKSGHQWTPENWPPQAS
jgi:hypothetical protein